MRHLSSLCLLALLPSSMVAEDKVNRSGSQGHPGNQSVRVVKLDRKEPVLYDKDIEPILINKCSFCHSGNGQGRQARHGQLRGAHQGRQARQPIVPRQSRREPARSSWPAGPRSRSCRPRARSR